jgi:uncharacterized protein YeaO (DUF488 family)
VDRLWPRGLSKERARLDDWMKDIAPSDDLRKWFAHRVERWDAFRAAYLEELKGHAGRLEEIEKLARRGPVTLLFAARDEAHNNAVVIAEYLARRRARGRGR